MKKRWRIALFSLILVSLPWFSGLAFSDSITLDRSTQNEALLHFSFAYLSEKDKISSLTPTVVAKLNFTSATQQLPNFAYDNGQLIARFEFNNQSDKNDWILRLGNPHLKNLTLYELRNGSLEEILRTGINEPFISRPIAFRDFWLPLRIESSSKQTFYVVTESAQWLSLLPHLTAPTIAQDIQNREWGLQLLGFGGVVFILLYNLFVYFVTRDRVYLFYVLASVAINLLVIPGCSGLVSYVFPYTPKLAQQIWFSSAVGWIALTALFTRGFLLKNIDAPVEKKFLSLSAKISAPLALLPFIFGPNHTLALIFNVLSGIFQFVIFTIGWRAAFIRKYTPAFIFLAAWGVPIVMAVVFVLATQGFYPPSDAILYALTASSIWEVVCMATALGYRIVVLQKEKDRTQAELMEKAKLEGELQAARAVQEQLLPLPQKIPGLEFSAFFQPADSAGGDWYGMIHQEDIHRVTFYIGDITGHGITSAVLTGVVCGAVYSAETRSRQLSHQAPANEQLQMAAEALDSILATTAGRTGRMMSMCFLSIDLKTGRACALNAGHTWPIFARYNGGSIQCEKIPGGGSLLGSGKHSYGIHEFNLEPGDTLLLYTDGLVENEGPQGEVLNFRKLKTFLTQSSSLNTQMEQIEKSIRTLWSGLKLSDDVTFLGIRYSGS